MWFGTCFDRDVEKSVLEEALQRRDVIGVRIYLPIRGGLGADTSVVTGRNKQAQRQRSEAFSAFLRILDELRCRRHVPGTLRQCDRCLCWFEGGKHMTNPRCCHFSASVDYCPIRPETDGTQVTGHRWRPIRCDACHQVLTTDLDDLRAKLHATLPASPARAEVAA